MSVANSSGRTEQERLIDLMIGLYRIEAAARLYAAFTHGNLNGDPYRRREEAREVLRDALAEFDARAA